MNQYHHWDMHIDKKNIIWLGMNRQNASINTINHEVLDELNMLLQDIGQRVGVAGFILYSMKEQGFVAGADIHEFAQFKTAQDIEDFLRKGQSVFARLEALPCPTVAMIDGFCMGGGLELALACHYRVATQTSQLGFPEVTLGIHPGWGGTVRLPRLIGGFPALSEVILPGTALNARRAKQLGIIDDSVPKRQLRHAACAFILKKPQRHKLSLLHSLAHTGWVRHLLAKLLRHQVAKKINPSHYPAAFAVIDLWEKEGGFTDRAYLKEADSVEKLIQDSETAHNLTRIFLLRERLKSFAKHSTQAITTVHVIGAGIMGGDIAAWCALRGLTVTLQDQSMDRIAPAIARAYQLFHKKLRDPRLVQAALDRLVPDVAGDGLKRADVIIEAVFEQLAVKQAIVKQIEDEAKADAVIATNTSSIPLEDISSVMQDPTRLIGIHFFNPVAKMTLVEVVRDAHTAEHWLQEAYGFIVQIGRLPLPVVSGPGFLVNRVLMPYLLEAVKLLEEGYAPEIIDAAARGFGMMMGPIELADTVGLDICLAVAQNLVVVGGALPERLVSMVAQGHLGRKSPTGGFYQYKKGKLLKKKTAPGQEYPELATRLITAMLDEAQVCLDDGVVLDADLVDAGMIFGTGFAPFRGGPLHYAKTMRQQQYQKTAE